MQNMFVHSSGVLWGYGIESDLARPHKCKCRLTARFLTQQGTQMSRRPLPLTAVLTTEVLQSLLTDQAACSEMMGHLPDSHKSQDRSIVHGRCPPEPKDLLNHSLQRITQYSAFLLPFALNRMR